MMKNLFSLLISLFLFVVFLAGCQPGNKPNDMPKLYPCTVTITQSGQPLADAEVTFVSSESTLSKWPVFGKTNESGVAEIITYGKFPGSPVGVFAVTINKEEITYRDRKKSEMSEGNNLPVVDRIYTLVDQKYTQAETTSLSANVEAKKNVFTFDVGEATRKAIPSPEK